ncbi:MAG: hypothetical protein SFW67_08480 [Myxococcaceae bacterium]|nr:hypothetical protein [Myxococcaceae bacterium]
MKASLPFLALGFGLTFGVIASSCGPSRPLCTPTSCTGCCDNTTGACITITSSAQCGQRGETCRACGLGESCTFGACSGGNIGTTGGGFGGSGGGGSAGGGSAAGGGFAGGSGGGFAGGSGGGFGGGAAGGVGGGAACDGCLLPNGTCRLRNTSQQSDTICGAGGVQCLSCVGTPNPVCSNGGCVGGAGGGAAGGAGGGGAPPSCNSASCFDGCCNGTLCVRAPANGNNQTCGFGGQACANCAQSGQTCNLVTLTCQSGAGGGAGGGFGGGAGGGFAGGAGGGFAGGGPGAGDSCATAIPITLSAFSALVNGDLVGYANDTTACSGFGPDAVWSVSVPQTGSLTVTVTASGFAPRVSVRSTCTTSTTLGCDSVPSAGLVDVTTGTLTAGTYFIWVDSDAPSSFNSYSMQVNFQPSGAGGGGAGGGGPIGGGSAGGSAGSYVSSSIFAACDDLSVGATTLLDSTTLPAIGDDVATSTLPVPLGVFPFFGQPMSHYGVQTNGMVQFFPSSSGVVSTSYTDAPIPTSSAPNGFAAPLWNDLFPDTTSSIRVRTFSTGGSRFTVSWLNIAAPSSEFQAKFFATGVIEFHYCSMPGVTQTGLSIGVEAPSGLTGTAGAVPSTWTGSGIRFTP